MRMLTEEVGKASNIKSRVTRQSVTDALSSAIEKLKIYNSYATKGLSREIREIRWREDDKDRFNPI